MALRTLTPLRRDTNVRYAGDMSARRINREAWAAEVQQLITEETAGNRSRFAVLVGMSYKTVGRWLDCSVDVSEDSVRQVARALGINALDLLIRVGYYQPSDIQPAAPPVAAEVADDPALSAILETDLPPRYKARMIQRLTELRAEQRRREVDEVQWWIDQAKGA